LTTRWPAKSRGAAVDNRAIVASIQVQVEPKTTPALVKDVQASGATSLRDIAAGLDARRIPAPRGGTWSAVQVSRLLARLD
jgi:hypothetical protein